jgi:hypothetical protein
VPAPSPLVSLAEILEATDLSVLLAAYRAIHPTASDARLVGFLRDDWHALTTDAAAVSVAPDRFDPVTVERDGCRYDIFGVIHGIAGGDDRAYIEFVSTAVAKAPWLLIENGIGYYYRHPHDEWIPDFVVLGFVRSAWLGLSTAFKAPLLFVDLAREIARRLIPARQSDVYDPAYHALDPELRRGLDGALPAQLEIPWALTRFRSRDPRATFADPIACVPRSLFMAGYAVGVVERDALREVALLVGDLHTTEIAAFLARPERDADPIFRRGRAMALLEPRRRRVAFAIGKLLHLGAAMVGMTPVVTPVVALVLWWLDR